MTLPASPTPPAAGRRFLRRIDPRLRGSAGDRIAYAARKGLRGQAALDRIRTSYAASAERLPGWDAVLALLDQHPDPRNGAEARAAIQQMKSERGARQ